MLATAAVIGRLFSFEILQASSDADADSILERVEEAEKAGLVFSVADSPKARFEFSHELIRQAVLAALSAARRQRLHLEVADAIERTCSARRANRSIAGASTTTPLNWRTTTRAAAIRRRQWNIARVR